MPQKKNPNFYNKILFIYLRNNFYYKDYCIYLPNIVICLQHQKNKSLFCKI